MAVTKEFKCQECGTTKEKAVSMDTITISCEECTSSMKIYFTKMNIDQRAMERDGGFPTARDRWDSRHGNNNR